MLESVPNRTVLGVGREAWLGGSSCESNSISNDHAFCQRQRWAVLAVNAHATQASSVGESEDVICLLGLVHLDHIQQYCVLCEGLGFELGTDSGGSNRQLGHPAGH